MAEASPTDTPGEEGEFTPKPTPQEAENQGEKFYGEIAIKRKEEFAESELMEGQAKRGYHAVRSDELKKWVSILPIVFAAYSVLIFSVLCIYVLSQFFDFGFTTLLPFYKYFLITNEKPFSEGFERLIPYMFVASVAMISGAVAIVFTRAVPSVFGSNNTPESKPLQTGQNTTPV